MNYTDAVRKTVVIGVSISHTKPGDPMHPLAAFEDPSKEAWSVFVRTRTGLLPETSCVYLFQTEADANAFLKEHPVGSEIDIIRHEVDLRQISVVRGSIDRRIAPRGSGGDGDSPLAFDVLDQAGLSSYTIGVSKLVLDAIGPKRTEDLKSQFGENWTIAAVYEYCCLNLPSSSPAYVAALYQFHYYITMDDFAAGYFWRDLETLVHGVESAALHSLEMRKKAGIAGSEKSAQARDTRRSDLMRAMEKVAKNNPDICELGPETVAKLAIKICADESPALWKQGRGQVSEYIGEIRRGEAGGDLKARFEAMFGIKPLRRLPLKGRSA